MVPLNPLHKIEGTANSPSRAAKVRFRIVPITAILAWLLSAYSFHYIQSVEHGMKSQLSGPYYSLAGAQGIRLDSWPHLQ